MNLLFDKKLSFKDNNVQIGLALTIIGIVMSLGLMHGDSTLSTAGMRRNLAIPNYLCTLFLLMKIAQTYEMKNITIGLLCSILVYWVIYSFHSYTGEIISPLSLVPAILFIFSQSDAKFYSFKFFRYYLIAIAALGIIGYLSFLLSLGIPYRMVEYYSTRFQAFYVDFKFTYIVLQGITPRLCGLFAEPGEMGTFMAMFLIADNFNLKKIGNMIMLLAALCTFSLAFYLLVAAYLLISVTRDKKKLIPIAIIAIIGMYAIPKLAEQDEVIGEFTERFSTKEGALDRVSDDFNTLYDKMFERGEWLFGYGSGYLKGKDLAASGYKPHVLQHGVIGFTVVYGLFFLLMLKAARRSRELLIYLLLYGLVFYKSGQVFSLYYLILLLGGFEYIKQLVVSPKTVITKTTKNYGYSI